MGLFSKKQGLVTGDAAIAAVGYSPSGDPSFGQFVTNYQRELAQIAQQVGWLPKDGTSIPILADLKPCADPKGRAATEIVVAGKRVGYSVESPKRTALIELFEGLGRMTAVRVWL